MKIKLSIVALVLVITGCATNAPLSLTQKVTLDPYAEQMSLACVAQQEFKKSVDESTKARCDSHAKYTVKKMEALYLQYNEVSLVQRCDLDSVKASNTCFYKHQNDYYAETTASFIKKLYSVK